MAALACRRYRRVPVQRRLHAPTCAPTVNLPEVMVASLVLILLVSVAGAWGQATRAASLEPVEARGAAGRSRTTVRS